MTDRRRSSWIALALAAALAAGPTAACFSEQGMVDPDGEGECAPLPVGSDVAGAVFVPIRSFAFRPDTVRVSPGTRVAWVNCEEEGTEAHTTTADDGTWDSPLMSRGDYFTYTFDQTGEYPYHCEPHPFMRGVVIVE